MSMPIPLILVPGLLCTERLWREQRTALADLAEITVTTAQTKYEDIAEIGARILELAPPKFALAGLSFGG